MWKRLGIVIKFIISGPKKRLEVAVVVCVWREYPGYFRDIPGLWNMISLPRSMRNPFGIMGCIPKNCNHCPPYCQGGLAVLPGGRQTHWNVHHIIIYGWNWSLLKWRTNSYSTQVVDLWPATPLAMFPVSHLTWDECARVYSTQVFRHLECRNIPSKCGSQVMELTLLWMVVLWNPRLKNGCDNSGWLNFFTYP